MSIFNLDSELIVLEVSGNDARVYLQGQLSNDILELSHKPYQLSAHLNNKGRMLASFIITSPKADTYYLITAKSIAEQIIPRLKMFILRSKVTLALSQQSIYLSHLPVSDLHSIAIGENEYLNIGNYSGDSELIDSNQWHKWIVGQAIPLIYGETYEKIIPQQVNYDLIGGVNFKKGCYTGQEIVARTHYLGKVKRRMAHFTSSAKPEIGQTVVSPLLDNQEIGFIVDYYFEDNQYRGLVSLQSANLENAFLDIANTKPLNCTSIINEAPGE